MFKLITFLMLFVILSPFPCYADKLTFAFFYDKTISPSAIEAVLNVAKMINATAMETDQPQTTKKADAVSVQVYKTPADQTGEGFTIKTKGKGKDRIYSISSTTDTGVMYGVYRFAEELGIRFFHPEQTFVPEKFKTPDINKTYKPSYNIRGYQPHTLHPIEMMFALYYPENKAYAYHYIDWLARNGQNFLVFPLLQNIEPKWKDWSAYMSELVDYAHKKGVKIGPSVQLFPGMQKNSYFFQANDPNWKQKVDKKLQTIFSVPWDFVEGELGEFVHADPQKTVEWFDYIASELKSKYNASFDVKVHVGGKLKVTYQGQELLYYFLPKFSLRDVGVMVHAVMFYDLFRPAPAYDHDNFYDHREYLIDQIGKRRVIYFPESAYWCSFDIDVPVWFTEYLYARWNDMHSLSKYDMDGHVTFTSGFEWMHFLTDYLVAKQTWDKKVSLENLLSWFTDVFGDSLEAVKKVLLDVIRVQNDFLIERNLTAFLSGEDFHDEIGWSANMETHPPFFRFEHVAKKKMEKTIGEKFENDLQTAKDFVKKYDEFLVELNTLREKIPQPALPWYNEMVDSLEITKLRAEHVVKLYEGAFELRSGNEKGAQNALDAAKKIRLAAEQVIRRRELAYRYPPSMMYERRENYTIYPFAYLHQAHTLCYWTRREEELKQNIQGKFNPGLLPKCL